MLKARVIGSLERFGLLTSAEWAKNMICLMRYANKKQYRVNVEGSQVCFSTADGYSKKLFYAKREGSELFEASVVKQIAHRAKYSRVFADVGAHVGYYSCIAGVSNPDTAVYSFEMNHKLVDLIRKNLALNALRTATVIHSAVSDTSKTVYYRAGTYSTGERMISKAEKRDRQKYYPCPGIVLDEYFGRKGIFPDLLKIDVEGAEVNVLWGAENIIRTARPVILLEVHPANIELFGNRCEDLTAFLIKHTYRIQRVKSFRQAGVPGAEWETLNDPYTQVGQSNEMLLCTPRQNT